MNLSEGCSRWQVLGLVLLLLLGLSQLAQAQRAPTKLYTEAAETGPEPASTLAPACQPCPAGTFANTTEGNNCTIYDKHGFCHDIKGTCPFPEKTRGSRAPTTYCQICPAGTFSNKSRSLSCSPCDAGKTSPSNASKCDYCPRGMIRHADWPTCQFCQAGHEPDQDHLECVLCPHDHYSDATTGFVCKPCGPPHFTFPNRTACMTCPPGHRSKDGETCEPCPGGYVWFNVTGDCTPCPGGSECAFVDTPSYCARCQRCKPGSYSNEASNCTLCSPGRYEDESGSSAPCKGCDHGYYQPSMGATACSQCQEGYYCPNASSSLPCPSGRFCPPGSVSPLECSSLYEPDNTGCRPSIELIVIIAVSSAVGFGALLIIVYLLYMKAERTSQRNAEVMPLRPPRDPVYGGL